MMSKERELLKECESMLCELNGTVGIRLRDRITELLAQPEMNIKPNLLSDEELELATRGMSESAAAIFCRGARLAERYYGSRDKK
jgi:hypothetical protein